jgi:hypothetical protein
VTTISNHLPCPDCGGSDSLSKTEFISHCFRCYLTTYFDLGLKVYRYDNDKYSE